MFDYFAASVAFAERSFADACAALQAAGFNRVDIWSVVNWCTHLPPADMQPDLDSVEAYAC